MKRVAIVGVGALGSHVALFLRNEATLRLIDFDRVEQKNLLSQFNTKPGSFKTQSLQQIMNFLFKILPEVNGFKLGPNNAWGLLGNCDLVIDCLDNAEGRKAVQECVRAKHIPCIHGALGADGGFGRVVWDEIFKIDDGAVGAATCEGGEHLPFITLVSSCIARAAQGFLRTGKKNGFEIAPTCAVTPT